MRAFVCPKYGPPERFEAGQVVPVLDRGFPLSKLVEAHRYVSRGHEAGGVAVTV